MNIDDKMELLLDIFELDEGDLDEATRLEELECWDSMAKLSLIVLMDDEFDKKLSGEQIRSFITVGDILAFME